MKKKVRWPLGSSGVKIQSARLIIKLSVPRPYSLHGTILNAADRFSCEKWVAHTRKTDLIANDLGLQPITILV